MATIDINKFEVIDEIREGNFGNVYLVINRKTNKYYAAKVLHIMINEKTTNDPKTLSTFRDVNLMSLLNHPCVLKFVGYYPNFDGMPTIITEFATKNTLKDIIHLESNGFSPDELTDTKKLINIYGIAAGMSYLHSQNILHGNLKPSNIFIDEYLHPKISDFGLLMMKTFLAPEILRYEKYSKFSDVYAFGSIVYEILTCETPL